MCGGLEELRAALYENMKARVQHFKPHSEPRQPLPANILQPGAWWRTPAINWEMCEFWDLSSL